MNLVSLLKAARAQPPLRRVLAVDAGNRTLKLLLAQSDFGRLRILKQELVDLQTEGLVSADETKAHLQARLAEWGRPPISVVLPQHLSISQVIEISQNSGDDINRLIEAETVRLSGVSESRIVHGFAPIQGAGQGRGEYWVTLAQEGEIEGRISSLGVEEEDLCEVVTTANALVTAFCHAAPQVSRAILVQLGAQTTVVVVVLAGQGAFATSFQMGSDGFTHAIARFKGGPEEEAEALKRGRNLFQEPNSRGLVEAVDGWATEVKRQLNEWFEQNPAAAAEAASFALVASGAGFDQPGLLDHLRRQSGLDLRAWPPAGGDEPARPQAGFEIAFGAALQALGHCAHPVSLLPQARRAKWARRVVSQRFEFGSAILLVAACLVLLLGTWRQGTLLARKQALLAKVRDAQQTLSTNNLLTIHLLSQYDNLKSMLASERNTQDTLATLSRLQQARGERSFWYVLAADQQSYFSFPAVTGTNRPGRISPAPDATPPDRPRTPAYEAFVGPMPPSNPPPVRSGLIAELCVPGDSETARSALGQMVKDLKADPRFARVDLLSEDLHRNLEDPKVVLADRHFVLALDFAANDFQQPLPVRRPVLDPASSGRRTGRGFRGAPESANPRRAGP